MAESCLSTIYNNRPKILSNLSPTLSAKIHLMENTLFTINFHEKKIHENENTSRFRWLKVLYLPFTIVDAKSYQIPTEPFVSTIVSQTIVEAEYITANAVAC